MRLSLRTLLAAGAAVALALPAAGWAAEPIKRDWVWGQTYSDLKPEADVRFGQLPNGLRYAVKRNATPGGQASLRLRIGAGSLQEHPDQQGLAHFLEHMAFKGSRHVPEGEMIKILERHGLAFGPDTNASTGFDETVFMLDLPHTDEDTLDTGLMLLRETATELTLSQTAMDSERGVILSEERLRDSPGYQAQKAELGFLLQGQRAPTRWPIGEVEVIRTAPVSRIRAYYEANYRPDDATVIAVGDFDPDAMVRKIAARFGDWRAKAPAPAAVDLGEVARRGPSAELFAKPGVPQEVQVSWAQPYDPTADTLAREQRDTVETLALAVLNRRLDRISRQPGAPFIAAQAGRANTLKSAKLTQLSVRTTPQGWAKGLQAAVAEVRRAVSFGVTPAELQRETTEMRAGLAAQAAGASTRKTPSIAQELVEVDNDDEVFTGPVQNLALFDRYVKAVTPQSADAALKAAFAGQGPLVDMSTEQPVAGGQGALLAALAEAERAPIHAEAAAAAKPWPYGGAAFGAPGKVVARRVAADLGVTQVRFANGVRLTIKPTAFAKDEVYVAVRAGEGRLGLPRGRVSPVWALGAVTAGGTRELTADQIDEALTGKVVSARVTLDDSAYQLTGKTRPADLATQMQLLAAYVARPGLRPEAFLRQQAGLATVLPQVEATPSGVEARDLSRLTHDGDDRFQVIPSAAALAAAKPDDLRALIGPALASGPLEITVVGDTTVDAAVAAVASTFAALPARSAGGVPAGALQARFPAPGGAPVVETHAGRADQAIAAAAWPTNGFYADPQQARTLDVTAQVLESRLIDKVRIAEGATYSPSADADASQVFNGYGFMLAQVETPPAKIDNFYRDLKAIAADMRDRPATPDEMERAKKPLVATLEKAKEGNAFWLQRLDTAWSDPKALDAIRSQLPDLGKVTAGDVQAAARRYLTDDRLWRLVIRSPHPAPGAPEQTPIPVRPAAPVNPASPQPSPAPTTPTAPSGASPTAPVGGPTAPSTKTGAPAPVVAPARR